MKSVEANKTIEVNSMVATQQLRLEYYQLYGIDYSIFEFQETFGLNGIWFWDPNDTWHIWSNSSFWSAIGYQQGESINRSAICQNLIRENKLRSLMIEDSSAENHEEPLPVRTITYKLNEKGTVFIQSVFKKVWHPVLQENRMIAGFTIDQYAFSSSLNNKNPLDKILDHSGIGIWEWNLLTNETIVNIAWAQRMGLAYEEIAPYVTKTKLELIHPDDLKTYEKILESHLNGNTETYTCDIRLKHKNGNWIWVRESGKISSFREDGKPAYMTGTFIEITDKEQNTTPYTAYLEDVQIAQQQTLARLEAVLEASTEVSIIGTDVNGVVILFNKGAENLLGYAREEVINKFSPDVFHDPQEIATQIKSMEKLDAQPETMHDILSYQVKQKGYYSKEWSYVTKNGTKIPILLTVTPIKEKGKMVGYLKVAVNIAKSKKKEERIKKLLTVSKDQNERLKNFAHIVSHNLRSHAGNFAMLMDLYNEDPSEEGRKDIIKLLNTASTSLGQTIEHLGEIVKINTTVEENISIINLQQVFNKVLGQLSYIINDKNFTVISAVSPKIYVKGVYAYLESIFLNIITNSYKYKRNISNSFIKITTSIENEQTVLLFKDNGLGIDLEKHKNRLFGMYKTFHQHEDARGIGLFITKNQVEAIGGHIEVESTPNKGTTFKVYLQNA